MIKNEGFDKVEAKDIILTTDKRRNKKEDNKALVVGTDHQNNIVSVVFISEEPKKGYHKCKSKTGNITYYYKGDRIYEIYENRFISKLGKISNKGYSEIISFLSRKNMDAYKIDYDAANFPLKKGSIIFMDGEYYLVVNQKDETMFSILRVEPESSEESFELNGMRYGICYDDYNALNIEEDFYTVIGGFENLMGYINKNKTVTKETKKETYNFGDVITLKNGNKVIYITKKEQIIYYVPLDGLEFFSGIGTISEKEVNSLAYKLQEKDLIKLAKKIERPLVNNSYPSYSDVKGEILSIVKSYNKEN